MVKLLFAGLDVAAFYIFIHNLFKSKADKIHLGIWGLAAVMGVWGINSLGDPWLNFFGVPIPLIVFAFVTLKISGYRAIVYTFVYHIIFGCGRELVFQLLYMFLIDLNLQMQILPFLLNEYSLLVVEYFFSFFLLFCLGKYTRKLELPETTRGDWCLLIMPIASIMILFSFVYIDFPNAKNLQVLMCTGSVLLYFANAAIFVILAHFTVAMNQMKMTELALLKQDLDKVNFDNMEKLNQVYRKYMHDFHRYFYQIRNLASEGENRIIINIVDEVEGQIKEEADKRVYVGNAVLNSIFIVCNQKAEAYGVKFSVKAEENICIDFMQDVDMISLFGNILDNAIEASGKCAEDCRQVEARLFMGSKYIVRFEVRNTWNQVLRRDGFKILTTKGDAPGHGLGISIIKSLANKYGGDFEVQEQDKWFVAILHLSKRTI